MKLPTRLLSAVAAAVLLSLTAACGSGASDGESRASATQENATGGGGESRSASGSGTGSDTESQGGADDSEICRKAQQALQRFTNKAASAIGDHAAYNKATEELSAELKDLADEADGELKSTLTSMARAWGDFKIDTSDLAQSANKLTEATRQISEQTRNLVTACA
ncbi:hypothetical protein GCM10010106_36260 [Thermopolyspora flexuosa]|uniref:Uncharacterized protein n=1 Tax=Thermopolyspora flexuosa TaxID=103836 RepID=A0A543J1I1_9ACTN|nr:hypothetical protein [Thermopolyspora flexuosa]TQM76677.1 hypothetical protein FHX40_3422 [Thermopolyspora flexuosa]GGM85951.1 hypothetical protein GCM10010106_36260 [Thermopolyspora flexuosa]